MTSPKPALTSVVGGKSRKKGLTIFERARDAKAAVIAAQAKLDEITDELRESFDLGKYEDENVVVTIGRNATLDKALAAKLYPGELFQELTYTAASLKRKLSGEEYASLQKVGDPKVTIDVKVVGG